jgi:hypothetical protein
MHATNVVYELRFHLSTFSTEPNHHLGYLPVTPGTLASGRACIGRLRSSFLAPQTLQTRWFATSGIGSRFGNPSASGSIWRCRDGLQALDFKEFPIAGEIGESYWAM